jgi:hypothetical protein
MLGRKRELDLLLRTLNEDKPLVVHVHGISGIGKTSLLEAFAKQASDHGAQVFALDCHTVEPTPSGFLRTLSAQFGQEVEDAAGAGAVLGVAPRTLILLDHYEVLRILDTWFRRDFLPALPDHTRIVFGSRLPPTSPWFATPAWHGLFRSLYLGPLDDEAARSLVARAGVTGEAAERIVKLAHGHPLALTMASALASAATPFDDAPLEAVLRHLARICLAEIEDDAVRQALYASCVVRRVTRPLLEAILPAVPRDAMERLACLPFMEGGSGGLSMHDTIKEALAADFESCDPDGFRACRRAAWRHLLDASADLSGNDLWRYTADMIYILRNPVVREAFFPGDSTPLAVEPARPEHGDAIRWIAARHEPSESVAVLERWWLHAPRIFWVTLHPGGEVAGFHALCNPLQVPERLLLDDPVTAQWWKHLKENRLPNGQVALFLRRWLSLEDGERPSPIQAAAWLDIKRHYMELRPRLRRVYLGLADPTPYAEVATRLGFAMLPRHGAVMGNTAYHTAMLDMGPASVDGWLAGLVGSELGCDRQDILDISGRTLRLADGQVVLTRLEFEVMRYLWLRKGTAVSRQDLLNDVWGLHFDGGSNVVDTVVASLRRKLGEQSGIIRTMRGFGYICQRE